MTTVSNPYDALYTNLKNRFTVIHDGKECTVGDFMLMKAGKATAASNLPVVTVANHNNTLATIAHFVEDKLTVKNPPVKDRTIRRFPLKTSASALLSSVAACALVMSCGIFALTGNDEVANLSAQNDSSSYNEIVEEIPSEEELDLDVAE